MLFQRFPTKNGLKSSLSTEARSCKARFGARSQSRSEDEKWRPHRIIEKQLFGEPSLNSLLRLTKAAISSLSPVRGDPQEKGTPKPRVKDSEIKRTGRQSPQPPKNRQLDHLCLTGAVEATVWFVFTVLVLHS